MKKLYFILLFILITSKAFCADIYLDIDATGCTGGGAANTNYNVATRACGSGSSKVYAGNYPFEASMSLANGDHLYIRAGTYYEDITGKLMEGNRDYEWYDGTIHITQNNITVENYNSEVVWIQSGPDHTEVTSNDTNNPISIWGTGNTIKGNGYNFFVWGCIYLSGTTSTLDGLDISGGFDHQSVIGGDAWYDVIRVEGVDGTVKNCKIHDNYATATTTDSTNKCLIMHEQDINTIFENNYFYNPQTGFVYEKYQKAQCSIDQYVTEATCTTNGGTWTDIPVSSTYRYNFFVGAVNSPFTGHGGPPTGSSEIRVYQNIFINGGNGWFQPWAVMYQDFKIYNNTFYNIPNPLFSWTGLDSHEFYNNIIYTNSGTTYGIDYREISSTTSIIDHNDYYTTGSGVMRWGLNSATYSSLSSWQALGLDSGSITDNPNFTRCPSISCSQAIDFKRDSYPTNGRNSSVMGAYMTGNETIGLGQNTEQSQIGNLQTLGALAADMSMSTIGNIGMKACTN